jgi:hypothetical protein
MENGGPDILCHGLGEAASRGAAKDQDGRLDAGVAQFQCLCQRGNAKKAAFGRQKPGHRHSAVTVSVGFDYCHDGGSALVANRVKVVGNGVKIYCHMVVVEIHGISSKKRFCLFYHENQKK